MKLTDNLEKLGRSRARELLGMENAVLKDERLRSELNSVLAVSDFIYEQLKRNPVWLGSLDSELLDRDLSPDFGVRLREIFEVAVSEDDVRRQLRQYRNYYMVLLAWQDLTGRFDILSVTGFLSVLAEEIIVQTYLYVYERLSRSYGVPHSGSDDQPQHMVILGMGKLGGSELNFSSDIDLVFAYPEQGVTTGGRREIENQLFFTKAAQNLIALINQPTADGLVYRVDMRLRPFGEDGQLVVSFAAMENYYVQHGRSWERYAMVKARVLGSYCEGFGRELMLMLRPFVYRRYFDFGAIDSLRKMKIMIEAEVRRRGLHNNIKLGEGGIREVEFVIQVFQLMRGGREPELQKRNLREAAAAMMEDEVISPASGKHLIDGYIFLRKLENILQEIDDRQTQLLPDDSLNQERVFCAMGYSSHDDFYGDLRKHLKEIHAEFREVVSDHEEKQDEISQIWSDIWCSNLDRDDVAPLLVGYAGDDSPEFARMIVDFRTEMLRRAAGPLGRETLNRLMPRILSMVANYDNAMHLFERISLLIRSIITRTTYLQLLYENSNVLDQVVYLCSASEKIAEQLSSYPILMDELIYSDSLYQISNDAHRLRSDLRQFMLRIDEDDLEQKMETLRQFKQIQLLKISASDIVGSLPLMRVSDFLTELAEAILTEVIDMAWHEHVSKYGVPSHVAGHGDTGLIAVAYGKLGGIELGYGSDLDLVFIHYPCDPEELTDGERPITVRKFYARLVQRIIHLFSIRTSTGILYDVDLRLRPDGDSGLLVSSIAAFEHYQMNDAWTWEHQALVRTRVIYGSGELSDQFYRIRRNVLSRHRETSVLRKDVAEMRRKMQSHLDRTSDGEFDLKQSPGGMVDIEFLAQYLVLAHAEQYPDELTKWSDNVRIFDSCVECGILPPQTASALKQAYVNIRNEAHKCRLKGEECVVDRKTVASDSEFVHRIWCGIFENTAPDGSCDELQNSEI